jgi:hypothetical protein
VFYFRLRKILFKCYFRIQYLKRRRRKREGNGDQEGVVEEGMLVEVGREQIICEIGPLILTFYRNLRGGENRI